MRVLIYMELDTPTANPHVASGEIGSQIGHALEMLKPEAAYFFPRGGRRAAIVVCDLADTASIVPTIEPLWLQLNAHVEMIPCMNTDDINEGITRLLAGMPS